MTSELGNHFRHALRGQAASVCVVAANTPHGRKGLTATAVMSLSVDPPVLAVAVNRSARLNPDLEVGTSLCVHLLAEHQAEIAQAFGGGVPVQERFGVGCWGFDAWGAPMLAGASASFSCIVDQRLEQETHSLIIARVRAVSTAPDAQPLLYAHGAFAGLRRLEPGCAA